MFRVQEELLVEKIQSAVFEMLALRFFLLILVFSGRLVFAKYHDDRQFRRSVHKIIDLGDGNHSKLLTFSIRNMNSTVYRDPSDVMCYIENSSGIFHLVKRNNSLVSHDFLKQLKANKFAGSKFINSCRDSVVMILLREIEPVDALQNRLRRDISRKRDPLRRRRQIFPFRGRFKGQTQSQYSSFNSNAQKNGRAEAEATQQSSHAIVSGNSGMGQAQSMSSGGTGCDGCPGYSIGPSEGSARVTGTRYPIVSERPIVDSATDLWRPGIMVSEYPGGTVGDDITYPRAGDVVQIGSEIERNPGRIPHSGVITSNQGGIIPEEMISGGKTYPSNGVTRGDVPSSARAFLGSGAQKKGGIGVTRNRLSGIVSQDRIVDQGEYSRENEMGLGIPGTYKGQPGIDTENSRSAYPGGMVTAVRKASDSYAGRMYDRLGKYPDGAIPDSTTDFESQSGQIDIGNHEKIYPESESEHYYPGEIEFEQTRLNGVPIIGSMLDRREIPPRQMGNERIFEKGGMLYPGRAPSGQAVTKSVPRVKEMSYLGEVTSRPIDSRVLSGTVGISHGVPKFVANYNISTTGTTDIHEKQDTDIEPGSQVMFGTHLGRTRTGDAPGTYTSSVTPDREGIQSVQTIQGQPGSHFEIKIPGDRSGTYLEDMKPMQNGVSGTTTADSLGTYLSMQTTGQTDIKNDLDWQGTSETYPKRTDLGNTRGIYPGGVVVHTGNTGDRGTFGSYQEQIGDTDTKDSSGRQGTSGIHPSRFVHGGGTPITHYDSAVLGTTYTGHPQGSYLNSVSSGQIVTGSAPREFSGSMRPGQSGSRRISESRGTSGAHQGQITPSSGVSKERYRKPATIPRQFSSGEGLVGKNPGDTVSRQTVIDGVRKIYPSNAAPSQINIDGGAPSIHPGSGISGQNGIENSYKSRETSRAHQGQITPRFDSSLERKGTSASYPRRIDSIDYLSKTYPGSIKPGQTSIGGALQQQRISGTHPGYTTVDEMAPYPGGIISRQMIQSDNSRKDGITHSNFATPSGIYSGNIQSELMSSNTMARKTSVAGTYPTYTEVYPGRVTTEQIGLGSNTEQRSSTYPGGIVPDRTGIVMNSSEMIPRQTVPKVSESIDTSSQWGVIAEQSGSGIPGTYPGSDVTSYTGTVTPEHSASGITPVDGVNSGGKDTSNTGILSRIPPTSAGAMIQSGIELQKVSTNGEKDRRNEPRSGTSGSQGGKRTVSGRTYQKPGQIASTGGSKLDGIVPSQINQQEQVEDGSESHAVSSVQQGVGGTKASASAQGKFGEETAQSQVSGTYSGGGSFSAQAGTNDSNKSAQTQVSGGKEGAMSNAQGFGGLGKSQAQVKLDSESGATLTNSQSSGWNHGTSTQVQASSRGGMAEAQANGGGQTSSQAQIGFQPYMKMDERIEKKNSRPFRGGGTSSAQSGTYRGQSQSQIEGSFQYGITYNGAAQAGSGSGAIASKKPFNFSDVNSGSFKKFKPYDPPTISQDSTETPTETPSDFDLGGSSSKEASFKSLMKTLMDETDRKQIGEQKIDDNHDADYEEYEDDDLNYSSTGKTSSDKMVSHVVVEETSVTHENDNLPLDGSLMKPSGAGIIKMERKSISDKSIATQENKSASAETRSLRTDHSHDFSAISKDQSQLRENSTNVAAVKTNYFTVSNSVAGKMADDKPATKNYEHRYYTKSSTCGYFTFSCNVVHGSKGRTRICTPKTPTNADGTPIEC